MNRSCIFFSSAGKILENAVSALLEAVRKAASLARTSGCTRNASSFQPKRYRPESRLTRESARLLVEILPSWISNSISAHEQNHDLATHCPALAKKDGLIRLADDSYKNVLKIRAFDTTIGTYALFERGPSTDSTSSPQASSGQAKTIRVQILDAHLENEKLVIDRVKPEGKKEMAYGEFLRSGARPA